ncbi:DUF3231 family protein [Salibacterium aidingense]|uniref:DUF3231 family protein n=1 Tax=Salibacterium aidingense TaxID=384933 RepID=UPI00047AB729|nr:DUF3231 family protein [Salibacterium aidingense]
MGILGGHPHNEPMHYGEVFGAWSYLNGLKGTISGYQTWMNHTGDTELFKLMENMVDEAKREEMEIEQLLKENGVGLPPSPPERAYSDMETIPVGARFNDAEISASITRDITNGLMACSQIIGQSTREDIAMMFDRYHTAKVQAGARLLQLNKDKGWLVLPPLQTEGYVTV